VALRFHYISKLYLYRSPNRRAARCGEMERSDILHNVSAHAKFLCSDSGTKIWAEEN
jgi:hypothetical protein